MDYEELLSSLTKRLQKVDPAYVIERNIINANGDICFRVSLPGVKTIEATNVKALATVIENLEDQKRASIRASRG